MTLNELYRATLDRLQVAADGEPAQPEDLATVRKKYVAVFHMMEEKQLADWTSSEDVPDDASEAVTFILAAHCAEDFFVPEPRKTALKAEGILDGPMPSLGERMLRKRASGTYVSEPVQTEYF